MKSKQDKQQIVEEEDTYDESSSDLSEDFERSPDYEETKAKIS